MKILQRNFYLLVFSVFLFCILISRFLFLDKFPPGMLHDEVEYMLSSKTYSMRGTDISGVGLPESLVRTHTLGSISAIPPVVLSPLWKLFNLNQITARLSYTLINFATSIVFLILLLKLFKNKYIAFIGLLFFLINPWNVFLSHFTTDADFALFFYLLAITILLCTNGWKLVIPYILLTLGFFSYNGAKLIILPMVAVAFIYKIWRDGKLRLKESAIFFTLAVLGFITFYIVSLHTADSTLLARGHEIFFLDKAGITTHVNQMRTQTVVNPLSGLFINKLTETARLFFENYLSVFNLKTFFGTGDPSSLHSFYYHGLLYVWDFLFIGFGVVEMIKTQKKEAVFLLLLLIIAPLATASSSQGISLINRSFLMLPVLLIFSAYGATILYKWTSGKLNRHLITPLLLIILTLGYIHFLFVFFFQLPVAAQENYKLSERILASYLLREQPQKMNTRIITYEPRELFFETVFYMPPKLQTELLKNIFLEKNYNLSDKVSFTAICPKVFEKNTEYIIDIRMEKCLPTAKLSNMIIDQKDAGRIFDLYSSSLCIHQDTSRYVDRHLLKDYDIEKLDNNEFCRRWVAKPLQEEIQKPLNISL